MKWESGETGMPVRDRADAQALSHRARYAFDDLSVRIPAAFALTIQMRKRLRLGIQRSNPIMSDGIGHEDENLVGALDAGGRLESGLRRRTDPDPDDHQRTAARHSVK